MNFAMLLLLHLVALGGGLLLTRLKAPGGALVGSMLAVVLFFLLARIQITYYPFLRIVAQVLSGMVIGLGFSRSNLAMLKEMVKPLLVLLASMVVVNITFAFIMYGVTPFDLNTALFATGLGGVADLALIAIDFNADMEVVALLQLSRLVTVVLLFPPIIKALLGIKGDSVKVSPLARGVKRPLLGRFTITVVVAFLGGGLFYLLKVPAGPILGAIFATALLNIFTKWGGAPSFMRSFAQILVGVYIGSNLTVETLLELQRLFIPYLIMVAEIFTMAYFGAFLFTKLFAFDWPTALFCAAPGGIQVMGLIGEEYGIDGPKIVVMHTMRIFGTLLFLPPLVKLFDAILL